MDQTREIDVSKISNIFVKMSYGENKYETKNAVEWLKQKNILHAYVEKSNEKPSGVPIELENSLTTEPLCTINISEIDTIKQILANAKKYIKWSDTPAITRSRLLYSLGQEIEKNSDLFANIELVLRGIIPRETKNDIIPLLGQYFYYYSIFAATYNQENSIWKPPGISIGIISNENILSSLGLYLAPALAAGYNVVLQVGTKIASSAFLLLELAKKVGISEDVIRIIPSDEGELLPYFNSDNVDIITVFADIYNGKYRGVNYANKKILAMCPSSTPILVFDDADLDSACEAIISMVWNSSRSITWSENYIFIQENIMSVFLNKLKNRLRRVKIGNADDKKIDIACPVIKSICKFNDLLKNAEGLGYEIFRRSCSSWSPILLIGNKTQLKISEEGDDLNGSIGFVVPFRSSDEAIALVNNLKYGMGISIWCENIKIINEVVRKIETTNVWVNKSPKFAADIAFSPTKKSGFGYFGGIEGFYEYVQFGSSVSALQSTIAPSIGTSSSINKIIDIAKKAQASWKDTETLKRISIFQKVVEFMEENKLKLSDIKEKQYNDNLLSATLECIRGSYKSGSSNYFQVNRTITTIHVPRGVMVMDIKKSEDHNIKLVLSAIFEGNAVILLDNLKSVWTVLSKLFPTGVLNICSEPDVLRAISGRQDITVYTDGVGVNPVFTTLPVQETKIVHCSWVDVFRKVTLKKNLWT